MLLGLLNAGMGIYFLTSYIESPTQDHHTLVLVVGMSMVLIGILNTISAIVEREVNRK